MKKKSRIGMVLTLLLLISLGVACAEIPKDRLDEINYIEEIMTKWWSNLEIHQKNEGVNVKKILGKLKKRAGGNNEEYLVALDETLGLFMDSHIELYPPEGFQFEKYHSGLHVMPVREGYALVKCQLPADCTGLSLPLLLVRANGIPVEMWIRRRAEKVGGSTELGRRDTAVTNLGWYSSLVPNPPTKSVTLLLSNGKFKTLILNWEKYIWWNKEAGEPEPQCVKGRLDVSGTFILTIESFDCGLPHDHDVMGSHRRFLKNMKSALKETKGSDSLMIDVRENAGGHYHPIWIVLEMLVDKKADVLTEASLNADGTWGELDRLIVKPNKKWRKYFFGRPAAILSGRGCGSICSYFIVAAKTAGIAMILGEPAQGTSGSREHYRLPASNAILAVPQERSWAADGKPMEGRIIDVDKKIIPSIYDYKNDPDPILTQAIQIFRKEKINPKRRSL